MGELKVGSVCRTDQILVLPVECKIEIEVTLLCGERTSELFPSPKNIEVARVTNRTESIELFLHEFGHFELIEDIFLDSSFGYHLSDMEANCEVVTILKIIYLTIGLNVKTIVRSADHHIAEGHTIGCAIHLGSKIKGHGKLAESRRKKFSDVLQYDMACNRCGMIL